MGLAQPVESLPSRASESNGKVMRLEYWNQSLRITKIVAQNTVILSEAQALRVGGQLISGIPICFNGLSF